MTRPMLDTPRGRGGPPRYLSPALVAAAERAAMPVLPRVRFVADRAHVAALLCLAFRSAGSAHVDALHHEAREAATLLCERTRATRADLARHRETAERMRDAAAALPESDRTPTLIAAVQLLLDGAPACCDRMNRALLACEKEHDPEYERAHLDAAERIVAEVCP